MIYGVTSLAIVFSHRLCYHLPSMYPIIYVGSPLWVVLFHSALFAAVLPVTPFFYLSFLTISFKVFVELSLFPVPELNLKIYWTEAVSGLLYTCSKHFQCWSSTFFPFLLRLLVCRFSFMYPFLVLSFLVHPYIHLSMLSTFETV